MYLYYNSYYYYISVLRINSDQFIGGGEGKDTFRGLAAFTVEKFFDRCREKNFPYSSTSSIYDENVLQSGSFYGQLLQTLFYNTIFIFLGTV